MNRILPYWLGSFVFDFIMFTIVLILFLIIGIFLLEIPVLINYCSVWIIFFLTGGFAMINYSYLLSFLYKSSLTVNLAFGWVNYFGLFTLFFILSFLIENKSLTYFLTIVSPFYNLFWGYISFGY